MINAGYRLAVKRYACAQVSSVNPIVLLHGWGANHRSWQPVIPALQNVAPVIAIDLPGFGDSEVIPEFNLDIVLALIAAEIPEKSVLIGWSLGGMLAVQLSECYPQKIAALITLAANTKFVAGRDYETAMPLAVNRRFNNSFAADALASLKLFTGLLAKGDHNERALLKQLRLLMEPEKINVNWQQALELLSQLDNRDAFANLPQPGLHLLAEKDALVPVAAAVPLTHLHSRQQVKIIPHAAHALHWSQPERVAGLIIDFIRSIDTSPLDKKHIAQSFSRAASTYDSVAELQRRVGQTLLHKIDLATEVDVVLDLGCGTGYFTPHLQHLFPQALVVGVDIAEGMLGFACTQASQLKNWVCADAELLPFPAGSVDLIYSNFALQWCNNLAQLFAELRRVLKPGGQLIFTTLGPETLYELKAAWRQVDSYVHVNQFHTSALLLDSLAQQDFSSIEFEHKPALMKFEQLSDLTRSLKSLGAQNVNRGRAAGLTGRKKIQAFRQAYERFRTNGCLPATYDVFYLKVKN